MRIRYHHEHLFWGLVLSIVFLMPGAGAMFYLGRELRDWEKANYTPENPRTIWSWDKKGLLWPFIPMMAWHGLFVWWAIPILWPEFMKLLPI